MTAARFEDLTKPAHTHARANTNIDPEEPDLLDTDTDEEPARSGTPADATANLPADLKIDDTAIDAEFVAIPGLVARWTALAGAAAVDYDRAKAVAEAQEAALYLRVKRELIAEGSVKPTEKLIEATMKASMEWMRIQDALYKAAKVKAALAAAAKGVTSKAEALISLGAYKRQEMKHLDPRIRDHNHPLFAPAPAGDGMV